MIKKNFLGGVTFILVAPFFILKLLHNNAKSQFN